MSSILTKEEAIALAESGEWRAWTDRERALFQLRQPLLCMDLSAFHQSLEIVLGRPVWTHEFIDRDRLIRELLGDDTATPTMQEIIEMIPAHKRLVVSLPEEVQL